MYLHRSDEEAVVRRSLRLRASTRSGRQGWMKCSTQVNCPRYRELRRAKDADRLCPKGDAVRGSSAWLGHTDTKTAGAEAGANSSMSSQPNIVNPTFRPAPADRSRAGASARNADGMAGRGCWKKPMPLCNGTDRSWNITPPCKRADFQRVVGDERTRRTFTGGNRK